MALAEEALAKGASPRALLKALGLDGASLDARKFNPDQPRVPAGNGRESGRWTSGESGANDDGSLQEGRSVAAGGERREECADGLGPDAQQYLLRFYGGLEISDPKGRGKLRIIASDQPDFTVTLSVSP